MVRFEWTLIGAGVPIFIALVAVTMMPVGGPLLFIVAICIIFANTVGYAEGLLGETFK